MENRLSTSDPLRMKKTILVVDDNRQNVDILSKILLQENYEVRRALDGEISLRFAKRFRPDLILLDITMPKMSGYEVCQHLKASANTKDIPVIFISALNQAIDKQKAFEMGGVDYITKPFEIREVLARVENHLSLHEVKVELRTALDDQLQQRADALAAEAQRSRALAEVVDKIRKTLDISTILNTSAEEVIRILDVDQAAIIRLQNHQLDGPGNTVAQSVSSDFNLPHAQTLEGIELLEYYQAGSGVKSSPIYSPISEASVIHDVSQYSLSEELKSHLDALKIHASLMVPLLKGEVLWGVFCIHKSHVKAPWAYEDIDFLQTICSQLGVALQQAELIENAQNRASALSQTLADLRAIVDNLADGLLVTDTKGKVTKFNPALLEMIRGQGHSCSQDLLSYFPEKLSSLIQAVVQGQQERAVLEVSLSNNRQGKAIISPILETKEDSRSLIPQGCVILIRDVTREKEVDKMKTDFLATVSHEMRTPLTSILGFASIIDLKLSSEIADAVDTQSPKVVKALNLAQTNIGIVVSEAERLTTLINDVLDIAKMEAGKVSWNFQVSDPKFMLEQALEVTSGLLSEDESVELIRAFPDALPACKFDYDRMLQVVINLISNAIKFTKEGFVKCNAYEHDGELYIEVVDSGTGLSLSQQSTIFEKFTQGGELLTSKPEGSGLGLSICRQIVEAHQGKIQVRSELGSGSCFSVVLPLVSSRPLRDFDDVYPISKEVECAL